MFPKGLPILPALCWLAVFGGGTILAWYNTLSRADQEEATRLTGEFAKNTFDKTVGELTGTEVKRVRALVHGQFNN
jgi:hypothetical protein